jgi:hypothetical protein
MDSLVNFDDKKLGATTPACMESQLRGNIILPTVFTFYKPYRGWVYIMYVRGTCMYIIIHIGISMAMQGAQVHRGHYNYD